MKKLLFDFEKNQVVIDGETFDMEQVSGALGDWVAEQRRLQGRVGSEENPAKNRDELPDGTGLVMNLYGTKAWYKNWRLHCENGPAIEWSSGTKEWWVNGALHREDGPAIEYSNGEKEYWSHGEYMEVPAVFLVEGLNPKSRKNQAKGTANTIDSTITPDEFPLGSEPNPATCRADLPNGTGVVVNEFGDKHWYLNGELHRVDGPAVEWANGSKEWWVNGELHATQKSGKNDPEGTTNSTDSAITSAEFPVESEQNPAKDWEELPHGTGLMVNGRGTKEWYRKGLWHREDGPALEWKDGEKRWYKHGKRHRENGPAIEYASGSKEWWVDNQLHREDGPAIENIDGSKEYWLHGKRVTEEEFLKRSKKVDPKGTAKTTDSTITPDEFPLGSALNPAKHLKDLPEGTGAVTMTNGTKFWYKNGALHREDGPAIEYSDGTTKMWYVNGLFHREGGPAVEWADGSKEYWLHGKRVTEEEFLERSKKVDPKGTANTIDPTITPDEFPVGSEQNPASSYEQLPDGTGILVTERGTKEWYLNGLWHREDGPAVEWENGYKEWCLNGERHREDGPAVELENGTKLWYQNDELHREDGPAIERIDGSKDYWLHGKRVTPVRWFLYRVCGILGT